MSRLIRIITGGLGISVDRDKLKITPFDTFVIPPPLSLFQISYPSCLIDFDFHRTLLAVVDDHNRVHIGRYTFPKTFDKFECDISFAGFLFIRMLKLKVESASSLKIAFVACKFDTDEQTFSNIFVENKLGIDENSRVSLVHQQVYDVPSDENILSIEPHQNSFLVLRENYSLNVYNSDENEFEMTDDIELPGEERLREFKIIPEIDGRSMMVVLTESEHLYVNNHLVTEDCTSFLVANDVLLFTVAAQIPYDHLYIFTLQSILSRLFSKPNSSISSSGKDWTFRNIEKNSRLVCCPGSKLIMQMPRGNFETINCRILLLKEIYALVKAKKYYDAFLIIRKNKMNSGLLIDIDIGQFLEEVKNGNFLSSFSQEMLDIFILDLNDDFCNELSYILSGEQLASIRSVIEQSISSYALSIAPKLNMICDVIEAKMLENQDKYLFNILVIYSKKSPAQLEKGLIKIKEVKDLHSGKVLAKKPPHVHAHSKGPNKTQNYKELLKYFCWLVKAEELYNLALSVYDLDMAVMIAEFTQMDPKEYLPYVEGLKKIQREIDFKTKICCDLKLYSRAIDELAKGTEEDYKKALELIEGKELFSHGIKVFKDQKDLLALIKHKLGLHLYKKKDYKQAVFYLSDNTSEEQKVLECCKKIHDWETGYEFLNRLKKDKKDIDKFLNDMLESYKKMKAHEIIAKIMKKMNKPVIEIIGVYIKAKNYRKAKTILVEHAFSEDEVKLLTDEVKLAASIESNELRTKIKDLSYWQKRLEIVQEQKYKFKDNNFQPDINDNQSIISESSLRSVISEESGVSSFSRITGMSLHYKAKNKKPKNLTSRKLKEGSLYEEEWLVGSLNKEIASEDESKRYFHLLTLLIKLDLISEFEELKDLLAKLPN